MKNYFHSQTKEVPEIAVDFLRKEVRFSGSAAPKNNSHYADFIQKFDLLLVRQPSLVRVCFDLDFYNKVFSELLLDLFKKLRTANIEYNTEIDVDWYFSDTNENTMELGEDFADIFPFNFTFIDKQKPKRTLANIRLAR